MKDDKLARKDGLILVLFNSLNSLAHLIVHREIVEARFIWWPAQLNKAQLKQLANDNELNVKKSKSRRRRKFIRSFWRLSILDSQFSHFDSLAKALKSLTRNFSHFPHILIFNTRPKISRRKKTFPYCIQVIIDLGNIFLLFEATPEAEYINLFDLRMCAMKFIRCSLRGSHYNVSLIKWNMIQPRAQYKRVQWNWKYFTKPHEGWRRKTIF